MELVKTIYELTREFPKVEIYGLSSQMQRSAVSIFKLLSGLIRSVKQ
jgi:four helix bundle protein